MTKTLVLMLALLLPSGMLASESDTSMAQAQFDRLKTLEGTWIRHGSTSDDFQIQFVLTAGDSVLVENWLYKGGLHSMTVYHLDHKAVIATHYCPQGNQPRLASVSGASPGEVGFVFRDATNLDKETQSYQVALSFNLDEASDQVVRRETYQKGLEQETSQMILVRSPG